MTDEPRTGKAFRGQRGDFRHCQGHLVGPADNSQDLVYFGSFCAKRMNSSKTTQNKKNPQNPRVFSNRSGWSHAAPRQPKELPSLTHPAGRRGRKDPQTTTGGTSKTLPAFLSELPAAAQLG